MAFILGFIPRLNCGLFAALRGVYPGLFSRYLRCICAGLHRARTSAAARAHGGCACQRWYYALSSASFYQGYS